MLEEPMQIGEIYQISFYLKRSQLGYGEGTCLYGSDELGVYFHTDTVYVTAFSENYDNNEKIDNYLLLYDPYTNQNGDTLYEFTSFLQEPNVELNELIEDEDTWVLVTDTVYANEAYKYMIFGQFSHFDDIEWQINADCFDELPRSRFLIDDVSVHLVNEEHIEADAGVDATICNGDSIQIGTTEYEDYMYWWSPNEEIALDTFGYVNPGMPWVKPTVTTTYTLIQKDFAFEETTDQVTITVEYCPGFSVGETGAEIIKVSPNPAYTHIVIDKIGNLDAELEFVLYDISGKELLCTQLNQVTQNVSLAHIAAGTYLYIIYFEQGILQQDKLIKLTNN